MATAYGEKIVVRVFDPDGADDRAPGAGLQAATSASTYEKWITSPERSRSWSRGRPDPARPRPSTRRSATSRAPRSTSRRSRTRSRWSTRASARCRCNARSTSPSPRALRTILRQDPDIIMVGEIRDAETAQMAVQAALTGHLVFSTVHTRNAAGAVTAPGRAGRRALPALQRAARRAGPAPDPPHLRPLRRRGYPPRTPSRWPPSGIKVPVERRDRRSRCAGARAAWSAATRASTAAPASSRCSTWAAACAGLINQGKDASEIDTTPRASRAWRPLREAAIRKLADGHHHLRRGGAA